MNKIRKAMFYSIIFKHSLLMNYTVTLSSIIIITRQSFIQSSNAIAFIFFSSHAELLSSIPIHSLRSQNITSLNILGAVVIGGAKSLWGTTFGVFIIYGLQSTLLSKIPFFVENPAFITMITGLLIILIVMFFPGGIAQMMGNLMKKRKTAKFAANTQRRVDGYGQN